MTYVCPKCGEQKALSELVAGRKQCKKCRALVERARYAAKREEINARARVVARENAAKNLERNRIWVQKNRDAYRRRARESHRRQRENLSDGYVRNLFQPYLKADQVPQALVEVKRQQLALLREVRKVNDGRE
jgi:hypothetical protein